MTTKPAIDPDYQYPDGAMSPWTFAMTVLEMRDLYGWQGLTLEAIGQGLPVSLVAANGSGKTQRLIVVAALWLLTFFPRAIIPITSGSWTQLEHQLWPALSVYEPKFPAWNWRAMSIRTPMGGELFLFSTNEAGRAEGYHGNAQAPCMYIIDEAKTVPDGIFFASDRCTVQHRILASSPGGPSGRFFQSHTSLASFYWSRRVTSRECPHIDPRKRERDLAVYGENDPIFRSMHEAEFTEDGEDAVILPAGILARALANPPGYRRTDRSGFLDFAAGGDENVLAIRDGNRVFIAAAWRQIDTMQAVREFIEEFKRHNLKPNELHGDEGGLGHVMIDALAEAGWRITRVNNASPALDPEHYANLGAEMWFRGARRIEKREVIVPNDKLFFEQATKRRRQYDNKQRLRAESKEDMRARGLGSPDRADAVFGALATFDRGGDSYKEITFPRNPWLGDPIDFSEWR